MKRMNLLLDTHVLLRWLADEPTLGDRARGAIADARNEVWVSAGSAWEVAIKSFSGGYIFPVQWQRSCRPHGPTTISPRCRFPSITRCA